MTTDSDFYKNEPVVVKTDVGAKDGQNKCPKCGATEISLNPNNGKLRCRYCRYEFEPEKVEGLETNIGEMSGEIIGSGTLDIQEDINNVVTLKCSSCGAEVVIDTSEKTNARCHWCRNTLTVNQQIPNGSIPDMVLPFKLNKEEAQKIIKNFVEKRKFFAHSKFKQEFTTKNIMGVYFPYMIVDANAHSFFKGKGEHVTRRYTEKISEDHAETYYDADVYEIEREFDLTIEGLTIESNLDRLDKYNSKKTNNVINAIMPFDIENCVKYNANYLKGYTSEKRDVNIDDLRLKVDNQLEDIARFTANKTITFYDRGVCWEKEDFIAKGKQWKSAYLPVWLYSYQEIKKGNNKVLHYVAVNARTREVMGSIPIQIGKLLCVSAFVELFGWLITLIIEWKYELAFLLTGFGYFTIMYMRYRNKNARHAHETETKSQMSALRKVDKLINRRKHLTTSIMENANNKRIKG